MNLVLFKKSTCPYCKKVLNTIEEIGIKDKIKLLDISEDKNKKDLIDLTGDYQVPCLVIDGKPMLESKVIINFLKEKFKKS
ncbi:MAG: glutathione S-transferase domain-containing protein [Candidatus Schekmanbacteria bacterium]|nr:MAG: glutathione S-transferase domain-containing protein [Candidatus Schekmanbacteria bacterium]